MAHGLCLGPARPGLGPAEGVGPSLRPGALKSLRALSARGSLMTLAKVGEAGGDDGGGGSVMGSCSWRSCVKGVVSPGGIVGADGAVFAGGRAGAWGLVLCRVVWTGPGAIIRGALGTTGVYCRRNLRLRNVMRPDPSTLTTYWLNWRTSMMMPVLSHLVGCGPVWFWMRTVSPTCRGGNVRVCSDSRSASRMCRLRRASSLAMSVSCQVLCGWYLPGWMGIKSRIGLPKRHMAGERWVSRSGVFRYCNMARLNLSVFRDPLLVFSVIKRFTVLTPTLARQLLWGKATEDNRCWTRQSLRNCSVLKDVNSGPPSEESSSAMP